MASAPWTIAICSVLSTERKIQPIRRPSTPPSLAMKIPRLQGGSYVIVQKYLHDLAGWNALPTEVQERINRAHQALGY